jgi:hypothetical protein
MRTAPITGPNSVAVPPIITIAMSCTEESRVKLSTPQWGFAASN